MCPINVYEYIKHNKIPTIRLHIKFSTTAFLNTLKFAINRACLIHLNLRFSYFHSFTLARQNPVKRSFQASWFSNRTWLHYNESKWPRVLPHMLKPAMRAIYSEIVTLVTILLVIPATSATSERTISALRRVKTYLRVLWLRREWTIWLPNMYTKKEQTRLTWKQSRTSSL